MLVLTLFIANPKPEDTIIFDKIVKKWEVEFVKPKMREILKSNSGERIVIERGRNFFRVFTYLKE